MRLDFSWWLEFGKVFNGSLPMLDLCPASPVCIDACLEGGGAFYSGDFFHIPWRVWPGASEKHINYKEVLTLEPAAVRWSHCWRNKRIYVYCDNQAAVGIINRGTAKDPFVMDSLRRVFWLSAVHNFRLKAVYYPGSHNVLADAASRLPDAHAWQRLRQALAHTWVA